MARGREVWEGLNSLWAIVGETVNTTLCTGQGQAEV